MVNMRESSLRSSTVPGTSKPLGKEQAGKTPAMCKQMALVGRVGQHT